MLITEMIAQLEEIKNTHGDLPVFGGMYNSYALSPYNIEGVVTLMLMNNGCCVIEFAAAVQKGFPPSEHS